MRLPLPTVQNHSLPLHTTNSSLSSAEQWPPFPYRYNIPGTEGTQWLRFTMSMSTTKHYSPAARILLMNICDQMLNWLRGLQRGSDIDEWHYVQDAVNEGKGVSHSILMDLRPTRGQDQYMSTYMALDAVGAFKGLVARYGALHGGFQIWEDGWLKGFSHVSIIEWPPARAVEEQ